MAAGNYTTTSNKPYEGEMKMADTREVFEAHFKLGIRQQKRYKDGDYRDTFVQDKWEGWQARERITAAPVQTPEQMAHMVETAPVDEPTDAERIMRAHVPARPILYTDTIDGEQCRRDDMWAVTTEELNRLAAPEPRFFMDHGLWHDRETGQHMWTQDDYDQRYRDGLANGKELAEAAAPAHNRPVDPTQSQPSSEPNWEHRLYSGE